MDFIENNDSNESTRVRGRERKDVPIWAQAKVRYFQTASTTFEGREDATPEKERRSRALNKWNESTFPRGSWKTYESNQAGQCRDQAAGERG